MKLNFKTGLLLSLMMLFGLMGILHAATIVGTITNEETTPIASSLVQLFVLQQNSVSYTPFRTTNSNQDGMYNFPNIPAGDYYVFANAPQYVRGFYADPVNGNLKVVEVDADDQEVVGINIQLMPHNDPPPQVHATINGAVFGNGNAPLPNRQVGLVNVNNQNNPMQGMITRTNMNGLYFFHDVAAGTYKTCVMGENMTPIAYSQEVTITVTCVIDSLNIILAENPPVPVGTITGNVIGGETDPVEGEHGNHMNDVNVEVGIVTLTDLTTPIEGIRTRTNMQGRYILNRVPAGTYKVCVLDENDAPIAYSDEVTVLGNDVIEDVNIILGTLVSYSVSGVVYNTENTPVQHGIVELRTAQDSTNVPGNHMHRTAHLNANGEYTITNVPVGVYYVSTWVQMSPTVFYPSTFDILQATPINVVDQNLTGINITLPVVQNYVISGTVVDDSTNVPLAGIRVKTDRMGFHHFPVQDSLFSNEFVAVTDANGFYSITAPVGRYTLVAHDSTHTYRHQFYDHAFNPFQATVIMLTHDFTGINFDLVPATTTLNNSISGTVTENGEAITYPVRVVAVSSDEDWEDSAVTGANGAYTINNIRPGSYYVVAYSIYNAPNFYNNVFNWEDADLVTVNGTVTGINFDLINQEADGASNVSGTITNPMGVGIENVVVILTDTDNNVVGFARTDELGQYTVSNIPTQSYTVIATKIGVSTVSQSLLVYGNESLDMVINAPTANDDSYIPVSSASLSTYPNPFNPNTNISFTTPKDSKVNVRIFNVKGQCIKSLMSNNLKAGLHSLKWDGTDNNGHRVTSGIYMVRLQGEGFKNSHKITLMK